MKKIIYACTCWPSSSQQFDENESQQLAAQSNNEAHDEHDGAIVHQQLAESAVDHTGRCCCEHDHGRTGGSSNLQQQQQQQQKVQQQRHNVWQWLEWLKSVVLATAAAPATAATWIWRMPNTYISLYCYARWWCIEQQRLSLCSPFIGQYNLAPSFLKYGTEICALFLHSAPLFHLLPSCSLY